MGGAFSRNAMLCENVYNSVWRKPTEQEKLTWKDHCRRCLQLECRQRRPDHNGRNAARSSHPFLHLYTKIRNSSSHGPRSFKLGRNTGNRMGTLMVGGRTKLRPQEARFERKLINPIKVYNENQLMRLRLSWLEPLARARACVAAWYSIYLYIVRYLYIFIITCELLRRDALQDESVSQ